MFLYKKLFRSFDTTQLSCYYSKIFITMYNYTRKRKLKIIFALIIINSANDWINVALTRKMYHVKKYLECDFSFVRVIKNIKEIAKRRKS